MDKTSKVLWKYIQKKHKANNTNFFHMFKIKSEKVLPLCDLYTTISHLESLGLISKVYTSDDVLYAIELTHIGKHKNEFSRIEIKKYCVKHWISIAALSISIAAFIKSFFF